MNHWEILAEFCEPQDVEPPELIQEYDDGEILGFGVNEEFHPWFHETDRVWRGRWEPGDRPMGPGWQVYGEGTEPRNPAQGGGWNTWKGSPKEPGDYYKPRGDGRPMKTSYLLAKLSKAGLKKRAPRKPPGWWRLENI